MATQILMPALSPTMEEGKLAKWLVKEGDDVHSGDILAEIETDKATMEFEAVDEGKIGKILVPEGTEGVKVNQPIAVLLGEGEKPGAAAADIPSAMASIKDAIAAETKAVPAPKLVRRPEPVAAQASPVKGPEPAAPIPQSEAPKPVLPSTDHLNDRVFASPLAKRLAAQAGLDLAALQGTGPRGRIVKADVDAAAKSGSRKRPRKPRHNPQPHRRRQVQRSPASRRCRTRSCSTSRTIMRKCRTIRCARRSRGG